MRLRRSSTAGPAERVVLTFDLRWRAAGRWYSLQAVCAPGISCVEGPAAPALLRLLAGRPVAHEGRALLDGRPLRHGRAVTRHGPGTRPIAAVLADDVLPRPWRTPLGLATAAARRYGVPRRGARMRGLQALGWLDAGDLAHRPFVMLDRAGRCRALLGCALAAVPGLLLLERPCVGLPSEERERLYARLEALVTSWETVALLIPDRGYTGPRELAPAEG